MRTRKSNKKFKRRAKYDESYIQRLKSNVLIEDIIKKDLTLEKIGKHIIGKCPLCNGNKSFCVSLEKQFVYCFQCNVSLDVISYLMKTKGLSFLNAIIEIKRYINVNNIKSLKKIRRAYLCTGEMKDGLNPYNLTSENLVECLNKPKTKEVMSDFHDILGEIIKDYSVLTMNKEIESQKISIYISVFNEISSIVKDLKEESAKKLKNLCMYLIYICNEIKSNNYNIGGLVLDLS